MLPLGSPSTSSSSSEEQATGLKKLFNKIWSFGSTIAGMGLTTGTALVILYLPIMMTQDNEKLAIYRLMANAFGIKLDLNPQQANANANSQSMDRFV
ncbi:hypothetical protein C9374_004448 [Naegleria lovaniensis]|uniref:Uncharacterized protein n=1 Tax=Naegleria lovaniensis TaxID=51637 RepID=A0AA88GPX1_NAELO|nr:uncharacterized protein C9374_004448 [Naegleria lovaniensis]KAG2383111.1 hypothetical protein C9374_004448 [Naegleria lovaniensis]